MNPISIPSAAGRPFGLAARALALIVAASLLFSGCTSLRTTAVPRFPGQTVHARPGQTVRVTTRTGERATVKLTAIAADGIASRDQAFLYENMSNLEVREFDGLKTTLLVALLLVGATCLLVGSASAYSFPYVNTGYVAAAAP